MSDVSTSLILLIVALVLLWLAVTDRLSRVLDAVDVVRGKASIAHGTSTALGIPTTSGTPGGGLIRLPSLPAFGTISNVPAV